MRTIGKYEVIEKIGEGGFGIIHKGVDPHIKRPVAIKCCTSEDTEVRSRFAREAQIAGNLHHRHIVTVYDFGLEDGVPYLVQEYLNGEDLDRKIKRKDYIPFAEKLLYLMQVARGLEYAHQNGVIHRDIKPANIRILDDGTAKIMDFGIAKLANQETGLTQTGMTLGTAAYLAPEQIRGEAVDVRTDIFSYGAMAYELLTYQRPFSGKHISTVLYQILNEEPTPLGQLVEEVPEGLSKLIDHCLEKDLQQRYASFTELLVDLNRLLRQRRPTGETSVAAFTTKQVEAEKTRATAAPPTSTPRAPAARPAPAPPRPPAAPPTPSAAARGVHEIELEASGDVTLGAHSIARTHGARSRGFDWGRWVIAVVTLAALGLAGWIYYRDYVKSAASSTTVTESGGEEPGTTTEPADPVDPLAGAGGEEASPEVADEPGNDLEAEGEAAAAEGEPGEGEEAEAEEPAAPAPAHLTIPAAWNPAITVAIGTRTYTLDRARDLELTPGRYTLHYRYSAEGYDDYEQQSVSLEEGQALTAVVPIRRPGLLDVQPKISTPQKGFVYLNRELLGPSPIRARRIKPGSYTLRIRQDLAEDSAAVEQSVTIESGIKLVVTFDLSTGTAIQRAGQASSR